MKTKNLIQRLTVFGIGCFAAVSFLALPTAKAQPRPGGLFTPPNTGAPKTRVGGGVRGGLMLPMPPGLDKAQFSRSVIVTAEKVEFSHSHFLFKRNLF